jgi:branched-chain amino acid transport system substrate-binding protein
VTASRIRRVGASALVLGLAAAVAVSAASGKRTAVSVVNVAGLQGNVAEGGPDFMEGMKVATWKINKQGGIDGVKLKVKFNLYQTGGTPEGAASAYRQAAANKTNVGAFLGAAGALAVRAISTTVKMPFIAASGNDSIDRPVTKYVFSNSAGYEYATSALVWAVKHKHIKSVAVIHYNTDFSSQIQGALTKRCAQLGCKVTDVESAGPTDSIDQLVPQLQKMKDSNPDAYYIESLNPNAMAAARQLGMFDKPVIAEQWLTVPAIASACGSNCEGVVFGAHKCVDRAFLPASDPVVKLCKQYVADWNAYHQGKVPYSQFSIYGRDAVYTYAFAAAELIKQGKPLTRDNIVSAIESIHGRLSTTHGKLNPSATNHRLTGTWHEAYVDTTIKMVDGKPTYALAPGADPSGATP